ncbi:MAG: multicopper oxidase domain-containing protein [Bacillota bacterium]|nr:multicopper oxidase domain-containing protein [Bacillota bacterium]
MTRTYNVVAVKATIVYNSFGDHDPDGMLYVLAENEAELLEQIDQDPLRPAPLAVPLTIRAGEGDTVVVNLLNRLSLAVGINIKGLPADPQTGDGAAVGDNPDSLAPPGEERTYTWHADRQGIYHFSDLGNPSSTKNGSNVHGLFGALIVEATGSWWTDPETGEPVDSGTVVDVHHVLIPDFREYAIFFHDEPEIKDRDGNDPTNPETGQPEATMPISYRSEPMRNRLRLIMEGGIPDTTLSGEEVHHDSWVFGDPATPVLRAYRGDPYRMRLIHGGIKETHVFHLHVHQWKGDPEDPDGIAIDSISISPQQVLDIQPLYGAGSYQRAYGDVVWHCHLYPHFGEGMWGILRVHDVLEDGTRQYPDGSPITRLLPLPDRELPPAPSPARLGFPLFIPGTVGFKAPRPPLAIIGGRTPTPDELNQFDPRAVPGAVFVNPAPDGAPVRRYEIAAIQLELVYNDAGWHDKEGRIFVLQEDKDAVLAGTKKPEPLFIRANAGEVIEILLTNELPEYVGMAPFQLQHRTYECSTHVHLVKFDPLACDGANIGWNYDSSVEFGQTMYFRWYVESELHTIFFHDHLFANTHQQHGLFAAAVAEAAGSSYHDPVTGDEVRSGTEVVVKHPLNPDFREYCLGVHDFALLFDENDDALNPPPFVDSPDDPGVMGVNYRSEPFQLRPGDPAFVFSSWMHGDPATPVFRGYAGDPVRIRMIQGAHEEQHAFNVHGLKWRREPLSLNTPWVSAQVIGISEAFNYFTRLGKAGDAADHDHLWYFGGIDDLWLGLWGLIRSYGSLTDGLLPLTDRPDPPERSEPLPVMTGSPPPAAPPPPASPVGMPMRHFEVHALRRKILYNRFGDNDPDGLVYVLAEDLPFALAGANPKPLVLRANQGDAVLVELHNDLPDDLREVEHPGVPVSAPWPPSARVSLHPQLLDYEMLHSDGATVGFNLDQTVGRGESRTFLWEATYRTGPAILWDFADLRNHRLHGLWAGLIVEARGSSYREQNAGTREAAVVLNPYLPATREFVLFEHDGTSLFDAEGNRIPDVSDAHAPGEEEEVDFEDSGHRAVSYRTEFLSHRLAQNPDIALAFSSRVHGDPATPLLLAELGEPVTVHMMFPSDKPRNHSLALHGHRWRRDWTSPDAPRTSIVGAVSVGSASSWMLEGGAGGLARAAADYMYRSGSIRWDIEYGVWGLMRVLPPL